MEIRQKILDTIYKHNKSAYGASSECIEVIYDDDYDELTDDLVKLFSLHSVSVSFEEGYAKGWREATSEACKEIAKNYTPNER